MPERGSTGANAAARSVLTPTYVITPMLAGAGKRSSRQGRSSPRPTRPQRSCCSHGGWRSSTRLVACRVSPWRDRKSTRLNSSHSQISYAVFCLKKKKKKKKEELKLKQR